MTPEKEIRAMYSSKTMRILLGRSLAFYIKILGWTCSFEILGEENHLKAIKGDAPMLYLLWHEQQMPIVAFARNGMDLPNLVVLVEGGDRGLILRRAVTDVGGNTSVPVQYEARSLSGGRNLLSFIKKMKRGMNGCFAVDGPDGPPFETKPGAMFVAKKTGAMILPSAGWRNFGWRLDRWDDYMIPLPFTKITIAFAEPFPYTDELNEEAFTAKIDHGLNAAREMARKGRNN